MTFHVPHRKPVRLHLTNVAGAGATQLLLSLLPALENNKETFIERIELPNRGNLKSYRSDNTQTIIEVYRRKLPNALSRILECMLLASRFDGDSPLLVLGDLPLRCRASQTVFLQQSNIIKPKQFSWNPAKIKYALGRAIFSWNLNRISACIVQTDVMHDALVRSYPSLSGRIHVISQPVPSWLLQSGIHRKACSSPATRKLKLFYPAAEYPHKNHTLLAKLDPNAGWPVEQLGLTLEMSTNPAPKLDWVQCKGFLSPAEMIETYSKVDALLFLSKEESYGFPLVEAMFVGLPIVCPDLPYAHTLCGEQAIYFDPDQPQSLLNALNKLKSKLDQGWWPNWSDKLKNIPPDWETVARQILSITCASKI